MSENITAGSTAGRAKQSNFRKSTQPKTLFINGDEYQMRDIYKRISERLEIKENIKSKKDKYDTTTFFHENDPSKTLAIYDQEKIYISGTTDEISLNGLIGANLKKLIKRIEDELEDDLKNGRICDCGEDGSRNCFCNELPENIDDCYGIKYVSDSEQIVAFIKLGKDICLWLLNDYRNSKEHKNAQSRLYLRQMGNLEHVLRHHNWNVDSRHKPVKQPKRRFAFWHR